MQDDDYVISDVPGGYRVNQLDVVFQDIDEALVAIKEDMDWKQWWSNVWFVNDHGNTDLLNFDGSVIKSWV